MQAGKFIQLFETDTNDSTMKALVKLIITRSISMVSKPFVFEDCLKIEVIFHIAFFFEVVFHFFVGRLSSWVKIRLHTENQLPMLYGSALKSFLGWGGEGGWVVV